MTLFMGGLLDMHTYGQSNQIESDRESIPLICLLHCLTSVILLPNKQSSMTERVTREFALTANRQPKITATHAAKNSTVKPR